MTETTTAPAVPELRLRLVAEARIELDIDIVGYFQHMSESNRAAYLAWDPDKDENLNGETLEDWQRPFTYLLCEQYAGIELGSFAGGHSWAHDFSDVEWWDEPRWTRQNFVALVAAVPWLAVLVDVDEEARAEMARVQPQPWDVPLFGDET